MIEEVLQRVTTTVTSTASQLDFKTELSFWFTVIGSGLGFVLGAIKFYEWWTSRTSRWLDLLAPKLREIRALLYRRYAISDIKEAYKIWDLEIIQKGFLDRLRKIEGLRKSQFERRLDWLFPNLYVMCLRMEDSHRDIISEDKQTLRLHREVIEAIDRILDKSEGK